MAADGEGAVSGHKVLERQGLDALKERASKVGASKEPSSMSRRSAQRSQRLARARSFSSPSKRTRPFSARTFCSLRRFISSASRPSTPKWQGAQTVSFILCPPADCRRALRPCRVGLGGVRIFGGGAVGFRGSFGVGPGPGGHFGGRPSALARRALMRSIKIEAAGHEDELDDDIEQEDARNARKDDHGDLGHAADLIDLEHGVSER